MLTDRATGTASPPATTQGRVYHVVRGLQTLPRRPALWAFVGSLALAALFGRVTLLHLTAGVVGGKSDGYENLWNDYWLRTALFHLHQNPFFSTWIEYPLGTSLRFHTLNPFGGLLALPLAPLVGSVAALNLVLLGSLVCATFFAYLLISDCIAGLSPLAAFVGAAVYTYANDQVILDYDKGSENFLMGTALVPLYCFLLLRTVREHRWGWYAAGAIGTLLTLALTDWQYTLFAIFFTVLSFIVTAIQRRKRGEVLALLARLAMVGGVWAVIVLPTLLMPMLREARQSPWLEPGAEQASAHAKSLAEFIRPGYENPGYLVLIITLSGLVLLWRRDDLRVARASVVFWATIVAFGCALALGPRLLLTPTRATGLPLPYALLQRLPLLSSGRKPFLFYASLAMLGIGVLLAFAICAWSPLVWRFAHRIRKMRTPRFVRLMSGVFVALLLVVTLLPSLVETRQGDFIPANWPPFFRDVLAKDEGTYAVLETPLFAGQNGASNGVYAAYQTIYNKPRFGSSISRDRKGDNPDLFVKRATFFRDLFYLDKSGAVELFRPSSTADFLSPPAYDIVGVPLLNYYHVRYIVLYLDALKDTSRGATNVARRLVRQALGNDVRPVYADAEMEAYRVPDGPPLASPVFLDTGVNGWWAAERSPDGTPYRWADTRDSKGAELLLFNLSQERRRARMQFTVLNFQVERSVTIAINGFTADQFTLAPNGAREVTLDLDVPPGINLLTLSSPQPPIPVPGARGVDDRLLSFGVRQVRMQEITH